MWFQLKNTSLLLIIIIIIREIKTCILNNGKVTIKKFAVYQKLMIAMVIKHVLK